jgi:hypothetical protein
MGMLPIQGREVATRRLKSVSLNRILPHLHHTQWIPYVGVVFQVIAECLDTHRTGWWLQ